MTGKNLKDFVSNLSSAFSKTQKVLFTISITALLAAAVLLIWTNVIKNIVAIEGSGLTAAVIPTVETRYYPTTNERYYTQPNVQYTQTNIQYTQTTVPYYATTSPATSSPPTGGGSAGRVKIKDDSGSTPLPEEKSPGGKIYANEKCQTEGGCVAVAGGNGWIRFDPVPQDWTFAGNIEACYPTDYFKRYPETSAAISNTNSCHQKIEDLSIKDLLVQNAVDPTIQAFRAKIQLLQWTLDYLSRINVDNFLGTLRFVTIPRGDNTANYFIKGAKLSVVCKPPGGILSVGTVDPNYAQTPILAFPDKLSIYGPRAARFTEKMMKNFEQKISQGGIPKLILAESAIFPDKLIKYLSEGTSEDEYKAFEWMNGHSFTISMDALEQHTGETAPGLNMTPSELYNFALAGAGGDHLDTTITISKDTSSSKSTIRDIAMSAQLFYKDVFGELKTEPVLDISWKSVDLSMPAVKKVLGLVGLYNLGHALQKIVITNAVDVDMAYLKLFGSELKDALQRKADIRKQENEILKPVIEAQNSNDPAKSKNVCPGGPYSYYNVPVIDKEPPSKPSKLKVSVVSPANADLIEISLSWKPSTDNTAVAGYEIYRDGVKIGGTTATSYYDLIDEPQTSSADQTAAVANTSAPASYVYSVSAFDTAGNEGALAYITLPSSGNIFIQIYQKIKDFLFPSKPKTVEPQSQSVAKSRADKTIKENGFSKVSSLNRELANGVSALTRTKDVGNRVPPDQIIAKAKERKIAAKELLESDPLLFLSEAMPAKTKALLPAEAQANVETEKVFTGTVDVLHIDDFTNPENSSYKYFLNTDTGRYNLHSTSDLNMVSGTKIQASGYILDNDIVIDTNNNNVKILKSRLKGDSPPDSVGNQRTLVILLKNTASEPEPFTVQKAHDLVFDGGMEKFMQEQSYGITYFSGDVFGWYVWPQASNFCALPDSPTLGAIVNTYGINLSNYDRVVYLGKDAGGGCSYVGKSQFTINGQFYNYSIATVGLGNYDYQRSELPFPYTLLDYILSHELGHSLGVMHANGWDCGGQTLYGDCRHIEYGNWFDTMGSDIYSLDYNAFYKEILGWLPGRVFSISQSGTYSINPLELNSGTAGAKINIFGTSKTPYYLEFRKGIGFDSTLNGASSDSLGGINLAKNQQGLFVNIINTDDYYPFPRLLDMHPTSLDYNLDIAEQATLNLSASSSPQIFYDQGRGITIGPVLSVSTSSITFRVDLKQPACNHFTPSVSYADYSSSVAAGSTGYVSVNITNQDYYGCGPSNFDISLVSPQWKSKIYPLEDLSLAPSKSGGKSLNYDIPIDTPPGAYTITIKVINKSGGLSAKKTVTIFVAEPLTVTDIKPSSGTAGTAVTITGTGFRGKSSMDNYVRVSMCGAIGCSDTRGEFAVGGKITYTIPSTMTACDRAGCNEIPTPDGDYTIYLYVNNSMASTNFHVGAVSTPKISSLSPSSGSAGQIITIRGSNFTGSQVIHVKGKEIDTTMVPQAFSDTKMTFLFPKFATTPGNYSITVKDPSTNIESNVVTYTVAQTKPAPRAPSTQTE